jgi:predicted CoA-binding protein
LNLELLKSARLGSVSKQSNDKGAFEDRGDLWRPDGVHAASEDIQQSIGRARRSIGEKRELESHGPCDRDRSRHKNGLAPVSPSVRSSHEILETATTVAVVGASRDPFKAGGSVPVGLQQRGFRIIPINPYADELFGERVYRSLLEIPKDMKVDIVDVFRPAADAPEIARQAVAIEAGALWLQLDICSDAARRIAESAGLDYVEDECASVVGSLFQIRKPVA